MRPARSFALLSPLEFNPARPGSSRRWMQGEKTPTLTWEIPERDFAGLRGILSRANWRGLACEVRNLVARGAVCDWRSSQEEPHQGESGCGKPVGDRFYMGGVGAGGQRDRAEKKATRDLRAGQPALYPEN